jgi:hypothetical protein
MGSPEDLRSCDGDGVAGATMIAARDQGIPIRT